MQLEAGSGFGELRGSYRDVLRDQQGQLVWDSGWHKNAIVVGCRYLLASLLAGRAQSAGIQGLLLGEGNPDWDQPPGPPAPSVTQKALFDQHPHKVPLADLKLTFLTLTGAHSQTPTTRLQIIATIGPGVPPWPEPVANPDHKVATLREFGLVGTLDGAQVLLNYVTHQKIPKDPLSTLERTIWLDFEPGVDS